MKHYSAFVLLAAFLAVGCGDSASNNDDNASAGGNNAATNGAPNGAANASANGATGDGPGWGATLEGAPVELPSAAAGNMTAVVNSGVLSLAGVTADGQVNLTGAVELGGELELKEYPATNLQLGYGEPPYACSQVDGLMVTITSLDPIEGSFAGPMSCQHLSDTSNTFEVTVGDGWFRGGSINPS